MTIPGAGGQVPARVDQAYSGSGGQAVVSPGGGQIVRARQVIVSGANGGVFVYSSAPPAFGNLVGSIAGQAGTDAAENAYLQGTSSYQQGGTYSAVNLNGGEVNFYTAPGAGGPWTLAGSLVISLIAPGTLILNFSALSGALNTPQPAIGGLPLSLPPPATYSQVGIAPVYNAINNIYSLIQASGVGL